MEFSGVLYGGKIWGLGWFRKIWGLKGLLRKQPAYSFDRVHKSQTSTANHHREKDCQCTQVQFSGPRRVAETWFAKLEHLVVFPGKQSKHTEFTILISPIRRVGFKFDPSTLKTVTSLN